jgi:transposase-like protein
VYEQGKRTSFGSPGGSREGDRRGSRRAARRTRGRWSAKREFAAVLRLLRGDDLETVSPELGVTAATLSGWREQFLEGGAANLKAREAEVENEETQRLKSLVADLSMSKRVAARKDSPPGGWTPFGLAEAEAMSRAASPFTKKTYGVVRVTRAWELARSSFYFQRAVAAQPDRVLQRRGPKTACSDTALLEKIREVLSASPFYGEGHRKVWARLRFAGVRTSKARVLWLLREAQLLAPSRTLPRAEHPHTGPSSRRGPTK